MSPNEPRLSLRAHALVQAHGPKGSPTEEQFDVFDAQGRLLGQAPRSQVHAQGLWHKAAHVLVFNPEGHVLVQQRAADKDVCPKLWDLSCAEHAQPSEGYLATAKRGLYEELAIELGDDAALFALGGVHKQAYIDDAQGICDHEMVMSFGLVYAGACRADPGEVACLKWMSWAELYASITRDAQAYTPWFQQEMAWHGPLGPRRL
jgi:isopentenyl-diphosphate delta-isomerase